MQKKFLPQLMLLLITLLLAAACGKNSSAGDKGLVAWDTNDFNQALKLSAQQGKPVMIVFGADW